MTLERSELLAAPASGAVEGVLGDVLHRAAREGPDDLLLCAPATGETWTAAQLLAAAQAVAAGLLRRWAPWTTLARFGMSKQLYLSCPPPSETGAHEQVELRNDQTFAISKQVWLRMPRCVLSRRCLSSCPTPPGGLLI